MKPITPDEVAAAQVFPDGVIKSFNDCIASAWDGREAVFKQRDVVDCIEAECCHDCDGDHLISRDEIFKRGWLNIEETYRAAGWKVEFDKPCLHDHYEPFYRFTK